MAVSTSSRHFKLLAVLLVLSMAFVGFAGVSDVSEDSDAGTPVYGNAYFSTNTGSSGRITGTNTSSGNSGLVLTVGTTYTYYFISTSLNGSAGYIDNTSSYNSSYVTISNTAYSTNVAKFTITPRSATSNTQTIVGSATANWFGNNECAKLNFTITGSSTPVDAGQWSQSGTNTNLGSSITRYLVDTPSETLWYYNNNITIPSSASSYTVTSSNTSVVSVGTVSYAGASSITGYNAHVVVPLTYKNTGTSTLTITYTSGGTNYTHSITITVSSGSQTSTTYYLYFDRGSVTTASNIPNTQHVTTTYGHGTINIPNTTPTTTGYTFSGWLDNSTGTTYYPGDSVTITLPVDTVTLIAQWTAKTYTVTFNATANGGTLVGSSSKTVTYGLTYGTLPSATKTGYTFSGWNTNSGGTGTTITSSSTVSITSNQTLYAIFTPNNYTVTFNATANGGTLVGSSSKTVTYDSTYGTLPTATKSGMSFAGWNTNSSGTGTTIISSSTVKITSAQTLYAIFTTPTDAGKWTQAGTNTNLGSSMTRYLLDTQSENLWYYNDNITIPSSASSYTVTSSNISAVSVGSISYTAYSSITGYNAHVVVPLTYNNAGTSTLTITYTVGTTTYTHSITITVSSGSATTTTYYVYYDKGSVDSASNIPNTQSASTSYGHGTINIWNSTPTTTGYTFVEWLDTVNDVTYSPGDSITITLPDTSVTLVAQWSANTYTVNFDVATNGGTLVGVSSKTVTYDSTYGTLPTATKTGYTFAGWNTNSSGTGTTITDSTTVKITTNQTLYSIFTPNTYTVTFDATTNGGTLEGSSTKTVTYDSTYGTLPTATKTGMSFSGWNTNSSGTGTTITDSTTVKITTDQTLYAIFVTSTDAGQWSQAGTYGDLGSSLTRYLLDTQSEDLWYFNDDLTLPTSSNSYTVTSSNTSVVTIGTVSYAPASAILGFNARVIVPLTYETSGSSTITISYVVGTTTYSHSITITVEEGSATTTTYYVYYDKGVVDSASDMPFTQHTSTTFGHGTINIWNSTPTATGYVFIEWLDTVNDVAYSPGDSITITLPDTSVTLVAQWTANTYTVNFDATTNGGTLVGESSKTVTYGSTYGELPTATKTGYTISGWNTSSDGTGTAITSSTTVTITATQTLYAIFTPNTYTVTFDATTNGGTVDGSSTKTVTYNSPIGMMPSATKTDNVFMGWFTAATGGTEVDGTDIYTEITDSTYYAQFVPNTVFSHVWWDNEYVNGKVTIAFWFENTTNNQTHLMTIPLYIFDGIDDDADGVKNFSATDYQLQIAVPYHGEIECTLHTPTGAVSNTYGSGTWLQFTIEIDAQKGKVLFNGTRSLGWNQGQEFNFTNYVTVFTKEIFDFSDAVNGLAIKEIYHEDTGSGTNHVRFQVSATTTYLDTYGYVMVDPVLNIYEKFPDYDDLRLNFYSFAVYGNTITINNRTFHMDGSQITDMYYTMQKDENNKTHYIIADQYSAGAIKFQPFLTNIYVTWENIQSSTASDRQCYITFVNDSMTIELGTFNPLASNSSSTPNMTISMTGIWYFTTAIYEPYTATERTYSMDWNSWFNLDGSTFIIVIIALLIVGLAIANRIWELSFLDYAVAVGGGIIAFIMIGGF